MSTTAAALPAISLATAAGEEPAAAPAAQVVDKAPAQPVAPHPAAMDAAPAAVQGPAAAAVSLCSCTAATLETESLSWPCSLPLSIGISALNLSAQSLALSAHKLQFDQSMPSRSQSAQRPCSHIGL